MGSVREAQAILPLAEVDGSEAWRQRDALSAIPCVRTLYGHCVDAIRAWPKGSHVGTRAISSRRHRRSRGRASPAGPAWRVADGQRPLFAHFGYFVGHNSRRTGCSLSGLARPRPAGPHREPPQRCRCESRPTGHTQIQPATRNPQPATRNPQPYPFGGTTSCPVIRRLRSRAMLKTSGTRTRVKIVATIRPPTTTLPMPR